MTYSVADLVPTEFSTQLINREDKTTRKVTARGFKHLKIPGLVIHIHEAPEFDPGIYAIVHTQSGLAVLQDSVFDIVTLALFDIAEIADWTLDGKDLVKLGKRVKELHTGATEQFEIENGYVSAGIMYSQVTK